MHQPKTLPSFIGAIPALRTLFENTARLTRKTKSSTEQTGSNFLLIDTFTHDLVRAQEENPLDLETERRRQLEKTLEAQLEAALREHLRTPYHTDANEIDWEKYASGQLKVFHRNYHQKDLRDHCQEAIDANKGAKRARYGREKKQMDLLYTQHILPELQDLRRLVPARTEILSYEVRQAYQLQPNDEIFVGQKHGLVMPANHEVYPDGFSYVNLHQLVYIPRLEKILVTIDQFFTELSYKQHAAILNSWKKSAVPNPKSVTEEILMETITPLPETTRLSPAFNVFLQVAKNLASSETEYRKKQQYSHSFVSHSQETLQSSSAFLTHILLMEYQLCLRFPQALSSLSQRLQIAFEMAAHPLLSGRSFNYQASLQAYTDQFLKSWLNQSPSSKPNSSSLLSSLESHSYRQSTRSGTIAPEMQIQRNNALIQLSSTYPAILNSFLSKSQCATGTLGGLSKMNNVLNSNLGAKILSGHNATLNELRELIGDRAEKWSQGPCVNPECKLMESLRYKFNGTIPKEHLPMVGECSLCMHCELQHQLKEGKKKSKDGDDLERFSNRLFTSSSGVAKEYLTLFGIQPDLLPTFFLAESHVIN